MSGVPIVLCCQCSKRITEVSPAVIALCVRWSQPSRDCRTAAWGCLSLQVPTQAKDKLCISLQVYVANSHCTRQKGTDVESGQQWEGMAHSGQVGSLQCLSFVPLFSDTSGFGC